MSEEVLLSNAWDCTQRIAALEHFRLDEEEFHSRHEMVVSSFECGKISLDEYLESHHVLPQPSLGRGANAPQSPPFGIL
jgi:hypothetical protein